MPAGTDFLGFRTGPAMFFCDSGSLPRPISLRIPGIRRSCSPILRPRSASGACGTGPQTSPFVLAAAFCCNYQRFRRVFEWPCTAPGGCCLRLRTVPDHVFVSLYDPWDRCSGIPHRPGHVFYDSGSLPRPNSLRICVLNIQNDAHGTIVCA